MKKHQCTNCIPEEYLPMKHTKDMNRYEIISNTVECLGPVNLMPELTDGRFKRLYKRIRLVLWKIEMWIVGGKKT